MFTIQPKRKFPWKTFWSVPVSAFLLMAADPGWMNKPIQDWTEEDARQVLAHSPWARTVRAGISRLQSEDQRREGGNMGQEQGIGFDGIDKGPRPKPPKSLPDLVKPETDVRPANQSLTLQLRWETALPIRAAEMKTGVIAPPTLPNEGYSLAVYGVPSASVKGDPKHLGEPLKSLAFLRREGKKDVRPSSVEVFQREDGLDIVYLFPLSAEITRKDGRVEFDAQIGRIGIIQSFDVGEMEFQGKLEL
ncbi:MAG: hypothetical protein ABSB35_16610 [Bryobacteraceae bacterium]|jgi:hypothetical protein